MSENDAVPGTAGPTRDGAVSAGSASKGHPAPGPAAEGRPGSGPVRSRRALLVAGVGCVAAAGGAWWGWRSRSAPASEAASALWERQFERPEGGTLALSSLRGRPWVLNFWATWCPPCIEELPELNRFHAQWSPRGWEVVGLAVDSPSAVRSFLQRQPLAFPIGLAGLDGATLSRELGNTQGGLPFTAVLDARGQVRHTKAGQTHLAELARWAGAI